MKDPFEEIVDGKGFKFLVVIWAFMLMGFLAFIGLGVTFMGLLVYGLYKLIQSAF